MTESSKCQLGVKIHTNLVGNIMLMISSLNLIESILSSSKRENVLVLLTYQNPFIECAIFESCLLATFLFGLRISALFNGLGYSRKIQTGGGGEDIPPPGILNLSLYP